MKFWLSNYSNSISMFVKNSKVASLLTRLQSEIKSDKVKKRFRVSEKYFTRNRILTFHNLVLMRLNLFNKSLSVEIDKISKYLSSFRVRSTPSKQAFSKAISHIKWEGFKHFNDFFVQMFYQDMDYQTFAGKYVLVAADGSDFHLPNGVAALKEYFGEYTNTQMAGQCMAKCVKLYDVLNHVTIDSVLSPYNARNTKGFSEKALFDKLLSTLPSLLEVKENPLIIIGDKYYPCFRYFYSLPAHNVNFVFRCTATFCLELRAFAQSGQLDAQLTIDMKRSNRKFGNSVNRVSDDGFNKKIPDTIHVRCVRIEKQGGETMFILTNFRQEELSRNQIGEIYMLRWGEETSFDLDKNTLEIENFASKTVNGVLQEFYAKTLTANIAELLINDAQHKLDEEQKDKSNKHTYTINRKVAYGLVKDEIVTFLNGSETADSWFNRMSTKILRHRSTVRKGRSFPKKRKYKTKFSMNMRRTT